MELGLHVPSAEEGITGTATFSSRKNATARRRGSGLRAVSESYWLRGWEVRALRGREIFMRIGW